MEAYLGDRANVKVIAGPASINGAATTGARVSMKNAKRVAFICSFGTSTGSTVQLTTRQHNAATGGTSKDLVQSNKQYVKADPATKFTQIEPATAAALADFGVQLGGASGVVMLEVLAEDLDTNGGFAWVSLDLANSATAKVASVIAIVYMGVRPGYSQDI